MDFFNESGSRTIIGGIDAVTELRLEFFTGAGPREEYHIGPIWLKTEENCRWKGQPRPSPLPEWTEIPVTRRFSETSHDVNSRGIGLVDMAYGIRDNREPRSSGAMAFHSMETMQGILDSASEHRLVEIKSRFKRPKPLPEDFPESEG